VKKKLCETSLDETITTFSQFFLNRSKYTLPYRFLKYSQYTAGCQPDQLREPHPRRILTQEPLVYSSSQTSGKQHYWLPKRTEPALPVSNKMNSFLLRNAMDALVICSSVINEKFRLLLLYQNLCKSRYGQPGCSV